MEYSSRKEVYKIILLGDHGVGKSSLKNCYLGKQFDTDYHTTLGADFSVKELSMDDNAIKVLIWDMGGQQVFALIRDRYYQDSDGIIIVFDLFNQQSLENTIQWLDEYMDVPSTKFVPIVLVGNKRDLIGEKGDGISSEEISNYIKQLIEWGEKRSKDFADNFFYIGTSAKTGHQVDLAFEILIRKIIERRSAMN